MIKNLMILACLLFTGTLAFGQQQTQLTGHYHNYFLLNPATAGSAGSGQLRGLMRGDWVNFPGAPVTQAVSLNGPIPVANLGLGIAVFSDRIGNESYSGVLGAYAYQLELSDAWNLGLGLGTRFQRYSFDLNGVRAVDAGDAKIIANAAGNEMLFDLSAGAFLKGDKLYAGLSAPQLLQLKGKEFAELKPHIYLMLGYMHAFSKRFSIEPSALVKSAGGNTQLDIAVKGHFIDEQLYAGLALRTIKGNFMAFMVGAKIANRYHLGYAYDMALDNSFQRFSTGSHELTLGLDFWIPKGKKAGVKDK